MLAAATPTGLPRLRAKASSCSASLRSPKATSDGASAGIGGMPQPQGIAGRFEAWLAKHADMPGASFLSEMVPFAIEAFGFRAGCFVHELVDSIIGDNYPVPDRMLVHNERNRARVPDVGGVRDTATGRQVRPVRGRGRHGSDVLHLQIAEGQSPAASRRHDRPGHADLYALLELPHLEDYGLKFVTDPGPTGEPLPIHRHELKKLEDPHVKAFFVVNPGNPTGVALSKRSDPQDRNL